MRFEVSCCRKKGKIGNDQISKNRGKNRKQEKGGILSTVKKSALNSDAG